MVYIRKGDKILYGIKSIEKTIEAKKIKKTCSKRKQDQMERLKKERGK